MVRLDHACKQAPPQQRYVVAVPTGTFCCLQEATESALCGRMLIQLVQLLLFAPLRLQVTLRDVSTMSKTMLATARPARVPSALARNVAVA